MQLRFSHAAALGAAALLSLGSAGARAASPCVQANQEAQDLTNKGKFREARAQLLVCAARSCNAVIRNDCERWLKELDDKTPTIIVRLVDSRGQDVLGATVTIDDARIDLDGKPVAVDPGPRAIKARAKGGAQADAKVLTAQGEKGRVIEVRFTTELGQDGMPLAGSAPSEPPPPPPPPPSGDGAPVLPIVLAAVGGVALGGFVYFEITGHSAYGDLENTCAKTKEGCSDAEIDPVKSKFLGAGITLGIAVVALGASAILYFTRARPSSAAFQLSPVIRF